jgi:hypothetical protein
MLTGSINKLNRSSQNAVFAALVIISTIAMYSWIVAPQISYLSAAQQYESAVGNIMDNNKALARKIEAGTKKLKESHEQLLRSQNVLFTPEEAKKFFGDLQTTLEETGCTVHSLNLVGSKTPPKNKRSKDTSGIVANSAMLSVIGQYNSIIRLLEKLQNCNQKIWIDSFKMEIFDFGSAQLKCGMTITIYTIQDKEAAL